MPSSQIICADALKWLAKQKPNSLPNMVTGIPDADEIGMGSSPAKYQTFFQKAVDLIFSKAHPNAYLIFMVTDRKMNKKWIDKSFLIQQSAYKHSTPLRWHKIILLRPVGSTHIQRPTYQHYLCFSQESGPGEATPDVMLCGKKSYKNASCPQGTAHAIDFLKRYSKFQTVIDPFVGRGTTLQYAMKKGFHGVGIEIDPKQCKLARTNLKITGKAKTLDFPGLAKPKKRSRKRSRKKSRSRKRSRKRTRSRRK